MIKYLLNRLKLFKNLYLHRKILCELVNSDNFMFLKSLEGFSKPGEYYSPIPDLNELKRRSKDLFITSKLELQGIDLNEKTQLVLLHELSKHYSELPFQNKKVTGLRYYYDNGFFCIGDAIVLYSMLRHLNPGKVIEIGSGFSSAVLLDVNEHFLNKSINITMIEPRPERLFNILNNNDKNDCSIIEKSLDTIPDKTIFNSLRENDILFIDTSHVVKPGSEILEILFKILPQLHKGVIIHFHDIFCNFQYPENWFIDEGRAWNEIYTLRAFLMYNKEFEIIYFNDYMKNNHTGLISKLMPGVLKSSGRENCPENASLWLKKL